MRKRSRLRLAVAASIIFGFAMPAAADTYMKQTLRTEAASIMGQSQPAQVETVEIWIGKDATRADREDGTSVLLQSKQQRIYVLNHAERSYVEMPMSMDQMFDEVAAAAAGKDEEGAATLSAMREMAAAMMNPKIKLQDTGIVEKVGDWQARKYLLTVQMGMGSSTSELWATEELKADLSAYWAMSLDLGGQVSPAEVGREMSKIKGVVVRKYSTAQIMGAEVKTSEELLELDTRDAPEGAYVVPAGYRKQSMFDE